MTTDNSLNNYIYEGEKERVLNIKDLKPGDHIFYERTFSGGKTHLYDHHAIVVAVYEDEGTYDVIQFSEPETTCQCTRQCNQSGKAMINQEEKNFASTPVFRLNYGGKFSSSTIVQLAKSRLHETGYNLVTNNCECFSNWCTRNAPKSDQVRFASKVAAASSASSVASSAIASSFLFKR